MGVSENRAFFKVLKEKTPKQTNKTLVAAGWKKREKKRREKSVQNWVLKIPTHSSLQEGRKPMNTTLSKACI